MPNQGKTTTSVLLSKYLEKEGKKTACLQTEKGLFDVNRYLEAGCYNYSVPLEAAKSRESFEEWLPGRLRYIYSGGNFSILSAGIDIH